MDAFIAIAMLLRRFGRCRAAAWPRPGDAEVTVVLTVADYPDGSIGEATVVIVNPDAAPVLVGITPRRRGRPGGGQRTRIASWTTRRRYRADRQAAVHAVPAQSTAAIPVPIPSGLRRCRLVIVVGQHGRRLRVISMPIAIARPPAAPWPEDPLLPASFIFPWPH